jgi:hypothetical protein
MPDSRHSASDSSTSEGEQAQTLFPFITSVEPPAFHGVRKHQEPVRVQAFRPEATIKASMNALSVSGVTD